LKKNYKKGGDLNMPSISIIVPIYNVELYLVKCIESILTQSFTDFELILVNDGSKDNCGRICDEYTKKDNRIKVIHKKNGGLSDARNAGIQISSGQYIGFVDSDDWIEPEMFEKLYKLCLEKNADVSTCSIYIWDNGEKRHRWGATNKIRVFDSRTAIQKMYNEKLSGFSAWNKLYKKSIFNNIKFPKGRVYEDAAIMYRVYDCANKIVFLDTPLYNYNYRNSSITRSGFSEKRFDMVLNYFEAYSYMEKKYPEMCERLDSIYFSTLRNMLVDLINDKYFFENYKYVCKISKLIKTHNVKISKNRLISPTTKMLGQLLAWCPAIAILYYKLRVIN
jgi:glycosyltransferase involved in cell wall biosynthesis